MALSGRINGSCNGSSGNKYNYWIDWSATQNVSNNTSTITATAKLQRNDGYAGSHYNSDISASSKKITVNGVTATSSSKGIDTRNSAVVTIASITTTVSHNNDGKKSVAISSYFPNISSGLNASTCSGTITLDTIPRASTLSEIPSVVTLGTSFTVKINSASSLFTHKVYYRTDPTYWGSWYDISTDDTYTASGSYVGFTPSPNDANYISGATGTGRLKIDTYNGSTLIGSNQYTITIKPANYTPTITVEDDYLTGNNLLSGEYVAGKSTATIKCSATSKWGATIKEYTINVDGKNYSGNNITTSVLSSGTKTITITVKDTRGKIATLTKSSAFTVREYTSPKITDLTFERQNDGTTVLVTVKGNISPINNKNKKEIKVTINNVTETVAATSYTVNQSIQFTDVPTDNTIPIKAELIDKYTSSTYEVMLPTVEVTMDFHHSGKGIALGKVSEAEGLLDVAWEIKTGQPEKTIQNLSYRGLNKINTSTDDTVSKWSNQGNLATTFYTTGSESFSKPTDWGFLMNITTGVGTQEAHQMWFGQANGNVYHRGGNSKGFNRWRKLIDDDTCPDYVIEQGTKDGWEYTKWNNGKIELYAEKNLSFPAGTQQTTYLWRSIVSFDLSSLLTKVISGTCAIQKDGMIPQVCRHVTAAATTEIIISTSSSFSAFSITAPIYIIGKWK